MGKDRKSRIARFFKRVLLAIAAPVWAMELPIERDFPTRTIEIEDFSFDPGSGTIHWTQSGTKDIYHLTVDGMVENPVRLGYMDVRALPSVSQVSDFHCVEGWTVPQVKWSGLRFRELLALVKPVKTAEFAIFHSLGETGSAPAGQKHYVECFSVADLLDPSQEILLALDMDDEPLSYDRGAPLRIVAPYRQAYKGAKFIHRVELMDRPLPGWWTLANPVYDFDARVPVYRLNKKTY
jgi:DMSO/TMAO reductase YedYZ molybdopterin-dependent catalytic subunit